mgnify:CR=1 FL=1
MNPRAGLKRAQKFALAEQILPPATQPRLEDRLRLMPLQASMPKNAQLHKARSRNCTHSISERMGFASTCRTKPFWQFQVAADQAVATALVSSSASNFSIHGHETDLSGFGWCRRHAMSGALELTSSTSKNEAELEGQGSNHDLT